MPRVAVHGHDLGNLAVARTADIALPVTDAAATFGSLLLGDAVLAGLTKSGFVVPSPIQLKAIPLGRCGVDLVCQAKSGTGKTVVFSVIALEALTPSCAGLQVLILAPTREIAAQIHHVISSIGGGSSAAAGLFIGGVPLPTSPTAAHIAVGTPGRVREMLKRSLLPPSGIRLLILDEVDKLFGVGFRDQVDAVFDFLPPRKQVVALSATYPHSLAETLEQYMHSPVHVRLDAEAPSLRGVSQYYVVADLGGDPTATPPTPPAPAHVAKASALLRLLSRLSFRQCVVFCNLRSRAQKLAGALCNAGFPADFITGTLDQKDRGRVMDQFRRFEIRVLVSTDLTARGVDVERVNLVVNVDIPADGETYLHRIGRTGRFGTLGLAVTILTPAEEATFLALVRRCNTVAAPLPPEVDTAPVAAGADGADNADDSDSAPPPTPQPPPAHQKSAAAQKKGEALSWCKWERGAFAQEGCWAHREGKCQFLHRDEAALLGVTLSEPNPDPETPPSPVADSPHTASQFDTMDQGDALNAGTHGSSVPLQPQVGAHSSAWAELDADDVQRGGPGDVRLEGPQQWWQQHPGHDRWQNENHAGSGGYERAWAVHDPGFGAVGSTQPAHPMASTWRDRWVATSKQRWEISCAAYGEHY